MFSSNNPINKDGRYAFLKNFKFACTILLFLTALISATNLKAEKEFRIDLAYGGTWHDAEKSKINKNDDWLCWASSAANVLAWTRWGIQSGITTEDDIFRYFTLHWSDHPSGSPREAWRWWLTGEKNGSGGAEVLNAGGGFWPDVDFSTSKWESPAGSLFRGIGQHQLKRDPYILRHLLEDGYGVVLQIVRPTAHGSRDSHMITLWGFRYSWLNRFKGILITDSDDAKESYSAEQAQNKMVYYPVELKNREWWFTYRGQEWKILAAYALLAKSQYYK
ncbi:MAG: hypothetical protein Q7U88_11735 [Desulfocapsaceae bacterium]|nr:hypothetical protein [Desulfocapsaceae bacterium]